MTETSLAGSPYPSIAALRAVHNELLKAVRDTRNLNNVPIEIDKVREFIVRGVATGTLIESEDDRSTAQGLLDYWSALAYRLGEDILDTTLAEFDHDADPELNEALCPYVGVRPFESTDAERFFGRKRLIEFLIQRLQTTRVLALVGSVGGGKSSVLRAGLIPALRVGALADSAQWNYLDPITPGSDPLAQLAKTLPDLASSEHPIVLLVDQFEELFTLNDNESIQTQFIDQLVHLAEVEGPRHTILIGMRSDIESTIARFPTLQAWFERGRIQLMPSGAGELREAIEKPAELIGLKYEAGLVDQLIQDLLGEPTALPLLQFTLMELWERRDKNRITWAAYNQIGAGRVALARVADMTYAEFAVPDQLLARRILLRLVNYERGLDVSTRRVRRAALLQGLNPSDQAHQVLDKLIAERLLRVSAGVTTDEDQIELAHDAIALNWSKMADWLSGERTALDIRRRLEARAAEWTKLGRAAAGLLDPVQLAEAEGWMSSPDGQSIGYDESLRSLVHASRTAIEENQQRDVRQAQELAQEQTRRAEAETARAEEQTRRAEAERQRAEEQTQRVEVEVRRKRQIGAALIFIGILAIVALALASYAIQQANLARLQEARTRDESETKVVQAVALSTANTLANQNAKQALENLQIAEGARATAEAARATAEAARTDAEKQRAEAEQRRIEARAGELSALALAVEDSNPQAAILLAAESVKIGLDSGVEPAPVALSTLQNALLFISGRGYYQHTDAVTHVAFDTAGTRLVTAGLDGYFLLWDAAKLDTPPTKINANFPIGQMVLSANGRWLAIASEDGNTLQLWDLNQPSAGAQLPVGAGINEITFSQDGQLLAAAGKDGVSRVWNLANPTAGARLLSFRAEARSIAISPDGRWILTGHSDGFGRLWNLTGRDPLSPASFTRDRRAALTKVAFSPNGRWLILGDQNGLTHLWSLSSGGFGVGPSVLSGQSGSITAIAITPSSDRAITASSDGSIFIWALDSKSNPPPLSVLRAHEGSVTSLAISPDGTRLASTGLSPSGNGYPVALWDLTAQDPGKDGQFLIGHSGDVRQVLFSPDGKLLVSVSDDNSLRTWDLTKPALTLDSLPSDPEGLIDLACTIAGREISAKEWGDFGFSGQAPMVCK